MNQQNNGFGTRCILLSFFVGGLIGAGVAMLTAPKTGEETRTMIRNFAEQAKAKGEDYVDQVKGVLTTYLEGGKNFIENETNIINRSSKIHQ